MSTMVFFNIGWMNSYRGHVDGDPISGGGAWVAEHGIGHEVHNFAPHLRNYYGAVQPPGGGEIHVERLGARDTNEYIDGVTVAWVAKHPHGGLRLIGWYGNARVYRHWQTSPRGASRPVRNAREQANYLAVAPVADSVLLRPDERTLAIPRGRQGGMGQANVWFAESELGQKTISAVRALIRVYSRQTGAQISAPTQREAPHTIDPARKAQVEQAAISAVRVYYQSQGFRVDDVQADNVGWDLEASRMDQTLFIEVKGLSGTVPVAELTPHEYTQMRKIYKQYRLCIVTDALNAQAMQLRCFSAFRADDWIDQHDELLHIDERVGARVRLGGSAA